MPAVDEGSMTQAVTQLLQSNQVVATDGRYTRPAQRTYPHQWLFDSCFHAHIYHRLGDPKAAADELRALFRAQVKEGPDRGRVPHMTFFGRTESEAAQDPAAAEQYRKDVALWNDERASCISSPPLIAEAVWRQGDKALFRELWAPLCAYYDWWLRRRCPRGDHLAVTSHVWEAGGDAIPRADPAFQRLIATGRKARALQHGTVNPTAKKRQDLLEARFLMLEDLQAIDAAEREGAVTEAEAQRRRLSLFGLAGIDMQAYLVENLMALADIGEALDERAAAVRYRDAARAIIAAVNDRLWDERLGYYVDLLGEPAEKVPVLTFAPLIALYARELVPQARAERLLAHLCNPDELWTRWPVPTTARDEPTFDPDEYWRGSMWIDVNWFAVRGLVAAAKRFNDPRYLPPARAIVERTLALVSELGFREYYRSGTKALADEPRCEPAGFGPSGFGWSGLILDFFPLLRGELADVRALP